jgi:DGQHR domain-containing protein
MTRSKRGKKFEKTVQSLLTKCGVEDVREVPSGEEPFKHQLDAIGIADDALLIVEAKYRSQGGSTGVTRSMIDEFHTFGTKAVRAARKSPCVEGFEQYRLILATNYAVSPKIKAYARTHRNLYIWDKGPLEYYATLGDSIGAAAQYSLLRDLHCKFPDGELWVPGIRSKAWGATPIYQSFIGVDDLVRRSFVARRNEAQADYYQRTIESSRFKKIADFLEEKGNFIPGTLLACSEKPLKWKDSHRPRNSYEASGIESVAGSLCIPDQYGALFIVDGQHRLYGAFNMEARGGRARQLMPVILLSSWEIEKQAKVFLEINDNAKPVQPALRYDLAAEFYPEGEDGMAALAVREFNQTASVLGRENPFAHRVAFPSDPKPPHGSKALKPADLVRAILTYGLLDKKLAAKTRNPLVARDSHATAGRIGRFLAAFAGEVDAKIHDEEAAACFSKQAGVLSVLVGFSRAMINQKQLTAKVSREGASARSPFALRFATWFKEQFAANGSRVLTGFAGDGARRLKLENAILAARGHRAIPKSFGADLIDGIGGEHVTFGGLEGALRHFVRKVIFAIPEEAERNRLTGQLSAARNDGLKNKKWKNGSSVPLLDRVNAGESWGIDCPDDELRCIGWGQLMGFFNSKPMKKALAEQLEPSSVYSGPSGFIVNLELCKPLRDDLNHGLDILSVKADQKFAFDCLCRFYKEQGIPMESIDGGLGAG